MCIQLMKLSTVTWLLLLAVSLALQLHQQHTGTGPDNTQHQFFSISAPQALERAQHQKYLTFLRFISGINNLNNNAGFIRRSLILDYNNQFPHLQQTFDEIRIGIRAIKKSLIHNNLLVNVYQPTCPKNGTFNASEINWYLSYTIQKEQIAVDILMRTPQLLYLAGSANQMYSAGKQYVKLVQQTMQGKFCNPLYNKLAAQKAAPAKLVFKNNLVAGNWYYGSTSQALYASFLLTMYNKHNLTACPLSKPYVRPNQNICFNCPPNSIYNLGTQNCDSCQPGYMLDISQSQCNPCYGQIFLINHRFICQPCTVESGQLYDPTTYTCITCGLHYFLNATSNACQLINCPSATPRFNRQLLICQPCPSGLVIDQNDPSICVNPRLIGICPPSEPYYIDELGKCANCPEGTVYNNVSHICETGPLNMTAAHKNTSNTTTAVLAAKGQNYTTIITATNVVNTTTMGNHTAISNHTIIGNNTVYTTALTNSSTSVNSTKAVLNGSATAGAKVGVL